MLPDFPSLKFEIFHYIQEKIQTLSRQKGLSSLIEPAILHEGDRFTIYREDGTKETKYLKTSVASVKMTVEDIQSKDLEILSKNVDKLASQVSEKNEKMVLDNLNEITEAYGNSIDAQGRPFTVDLYLEGIEKIQLNFDEEGNWEPPTLIVPPTMLSLVREELKKLNDDPELQYRFNELLNRKREEWLVQENNRKLVD
jgi:hypothetical protein